MISVVIVNSRGDIHSDWVQTAIESVNKQTMEVELIVIDNIGRKKTIGKCFNDGAKKAKNDYILYLGDDDWLSMDYCSTLLQYALSYPNYVMWTTKMIAFDEQTKLYTVIQRICTGMWRKEYLLKHPFNEELIRGIDREYIQEMQKRGDVGFTINHHFGYYYRKHNDYSCAGDITFVKDTSDVYVLTSGRSFIDPLINRWKKNHSVFVSSEQFNPLLADNAKVIWCEWLREDAIAASQYHCDAKKILRLHAYEAFTPLIHYVDFNKFDTVIFIAEHIKKFVESKVGKLSNAVVIPVGIDVDKFKVRDNDKNFKIAYAGDISRKKGAGELMMIAKSLPGYEFHVAGKFHEEDTAEYFDVNKPDNMFAYPYSYDLNNWFQDYTYFINTSIREGNPITVLEAMACGLKPLIRDWIGAKEIYGEFVYKNIHELIHKIGTRYNPMIYREFVEENFNSAKIYPLIDEITFGGKKCKNKEVVESEQSVLSE
jgi:glycosyltransferase involved in cell wall biosynthesis